MAAKKVLMLVGDFVDDYDAILPIVVLEVAGHTVHAVCPGKKAGELVRTAIHEFEGDQIYTEKRGMNLPLNATFDEINAEDYDGLVIPGGRSPEYVRMNERVLEIARHFAEANKPIASICHGQQLLAAAGVLKGRHCTANPNMKPDLLQYGVKWQEVNEARSNVCVDGNLVTAVMQPGHVEWLRTFLELLGTRIET